ncbi:2-aminomuconate deaminase [Fusarium phyllophilum]|uniref:2-aminomuconate deaminase n=1 Tax=Fusarium phyllophilum TaxID=47803 RepID=A0A8H5I4W0_9HYPO|nr:2-aminomuconate deaminase [Fusarium phyllophilum]
MVGPCKTACQVMLWSISRDANSDTRNVIKESWPIVNLSDHQQHHHRNSNTNRLARIIRDYLDLSAYLSNPTQQSSSPPQPMSPNGDAVILPTAAGGLANYPQARVTSFTGNHHTLYISGITSRREDGTLDGVKTNEDGTHSLDVKEQTRTCLANIKAVVEQASNGRPGLESIVEVTVFLKHM